MTVEGVSARDRALVRGEPGNLTDQVFEAVKREIVQNRLRPDTIIAEAPLAARFEVSRAPAREALKRLAEIGLVRGVPRVGYIVTSISIRDFDEVFQLRLALEPLATELATARLTDEGTARLEALAAEVEVIVRQPAPERAPALARNNSYFHREVAHISGNRRLERAIGGLLDELERVMHMLAHDHSLVTLVDQHPELVRAMREGDPAVAARVMREQLIHDYDVMRELALRGHSSAIDTTLGR
jgi:DNA-binding GntR family transcriptional regulator